MTGFGIFAVLTVFATVDGDTFKARAAPDAAPVSVRVFGINTPERSEPGYREARANLQALMLGKRLWCEIMGTSYERLVAKCLRAEDGLDPAAEQVKGGFATACPAFDPVYVPLQRPDHAPYAAFCAPPEPAPKAGP